MIQQVISHPTLSAMHKQIIDHISWRLNVSPSSIHPYTHLEDDLHLDAIDILLLIAELESRFNVYLSTEEANSIETIHDASIFLQKRAA